MVRIAISEWAITVFEHRNARGHASRAGTFIDERCMIDRGFPPHKTDRSRETRRKAWANIDKLRERFLRSFRAPRFRNFEIHDYFFDYSASWLRRFPSDSIGFQRSTLLLVFMLLLVPMNLYRRVSSRNDLLNRSTDSLAYFLFPPLPSPPRS